MMWENLAAYLEQTGLNGIFLSKGENVRYISGYTGEDAFLLVTKTARYLITDPRYTEQAQAECPGYAIYNWRTDGKTVADAVAYLAEKEGCRSVGYEGDALPVDLYHQIRQAAKAELVAATGAVEKMRAKKSPQEVEYLRAACHIACRALEQMLKEIRVGRTEKELAAMLSYAMVMEGADTQPYGNILISGSRTSLLHGIPSDRALQYGDLVLMDFGCQYRGYRSDMTRTLVVGRASPKQREVYALEQRMVEDSLAVMRAGATGKEVYEASTKAIRDTEYFPYHYSGVGHGIGLFVHERPFLGPRSEDVLAEGNVVTIEPGLYIPGWGGVRIEDQVLITADGNEILTTFPKELIEL